MEKAVKDNVQNKASGSAQGKAFRPSADDVNKDVNNAVNKDLKNEVKHDAGNDAKDAAQKDVKNDAVKAGRNDAVKGAEDELKKDSAKPQEEAETPHAVDKLSKGGIMFRVRDLNLYYGDFQALKNINLDIPARQVTAFIGPSGCGKSTLLRCFNRMNDLIEDCRIEGTIQLGDKDIKDADMDVVELRTEVGMVFQQPNPFPMSIFDNVTYGLRCQGIKDKALLSEVVETSLKKAALWDEVKNELGKNALKLSGGQQQRLCIARAIALQPTVILMDEPTSALDPIATGRIEELMESLKQDYTIIIVTHSMNQAARISDKTAFFYLGDLIEFDDTDKIFSKPADYRTEAYITGRFG